MAREHDTTRIDANDMADRPDHVTVASHAAHEQLTPVTESRGNRPCCPTGRGWHGA